MVPIRSSVLRVSEIATSFLDGRFVNTTFLDGQFCEQHASTAKKRVQLYSVFAPGVYIVWLHVYPCWRVHDVFTRIALRFGAYKLT